MNPLPSERIENPRMYSSPRPFRGSPLLTFPSKRVEISPNDDRLIRVHAWPAPVASPKHRTYPPRRSVTAARYRCGSSAGHGASSTVHDTPPSEVSNNSLPLGNCACAQPYEPSENVGSTRVPTSRSRHVIPPSSLAKRHEVGAGPNGCPPADGGRQYRDAMTRVPAVATWVSADTGTVVTFQCSPPSADRATTAGAEWPRLEPTAISS